MTPEPTRLNGLIRDTAARTLSVYPDMDLRLEVPDELPLLLVDPARIAQVLDNLLSNARKYAPGSRVILRAIPQEGSLRLEVEDDGAGIPAEHAPRLFERFFRVPGQTRGVRGTGLGLYICRKIIEAHGGEIGLDPSPGAGTRFYFVLPAPQALTETAPEAAHESQENHPDR
jgi:signal transduction histidine kinase